MGNWVNVQGKIEISLDKILNSFHLQHDVERFNIWKIQSTIEGSNCEFVPKKFFDIRGSKFELSFEFTADIKNDWNYNKARKYVIKYVNKYIEYFFVIYPELDMNKEVDIIISFIYQGQRMDDYMNIL